jgi:anthranilate synthase component 2
MKILVLDNYDSFTYNLVHMLEKITGNKVDVYRNNRISLNDVGKYDKIVLSPGPGVPAEAGILIDLIKTYAPQKSIFGVCLGMQAMAETYGGKLINLSEVFHGIARPVMVKDANDPLFSEIPSPFMAGRYHSWVAERESLPSCLEITALDEDGLVMGLRHKEYKLNGVQFHPESILTEHGEKMIENWLKIS